MKYDVYHLLFDAPTHFGMEGIGQERLDTTVHSDTLWAAIIQQWLLLFEDDPEELCREPPFAVSSCFPLINGRRFYPLPVNTLDELISKAEVKKMDEQEQFSVKGLKKISHISEELFALVCKGEPVTFEHLQGMQSHFPNADHARYAQEKDSAVQLQRPRLKTDQLTGGVGEDAFFYCTDQYFNKQSGLFFLATFRTEKDKSRFEAALRLLADSGLGGDRSVGRGTFLAPRSEKVSFPAPKKHNQFLLLSLYHPTRAEVDGGILADRQKSFYTLVRRYGYATAPGVRACRRADVWMLAEGSVLSEQPVGDIPRVIEKGGKIPHHVYRYGRAFCLPISPALKARSAR